MKNNKLEEEKKMLRQIVITGTLILLMVSLIVPVRSFSEEKKGPICYLKFDEGKGEVAKDSSGKGNDGEIRGLDKYIKWVEGRSGKALEFNAGEGLRNNGCVVVPYMDGYDFSKGLTVQAWINPNDKCSGERHYDIVTNFAGADRASGFKFRIDSTSSPSDKISLLFFSGSEEKNWGVSYTPKDKPKISIERNKWSHIAGVYDGTVFRIYIDGEEVAASEPDLSLTKGAADISIGAVLQGYAYGFNGIIDEIKIYDYPRPAGDILKDAKVYVSY